MKKRFRAINVLCILIMVMIVQCKTENENSKPNLLFIWTDQQQASTLAAYGNDRIKTPNLNRLAQNAYVFRNAYVTQPVCSPSRASIMTGIYPHSHGVTENNIPLSKEILVFPELMNDTSYYTAYMGKWHLGDEIFNQRGFDEWASIEDNYIEFYSDERDRTERSAYHHWLLDKGYTPDGTPRDAAGSGSVFGRGFAARLPLEHCKPRFLEERAIDFLKRNHDRPFMLYINFLEPHSPYFGPFDSIYSPQEVYLPQSFNHIVNDDFHLRYQEWQQKYLSLDEEYYRDLIAKYWGLVTQVDLSVGAILDELESLGLSDNTIVVYTSDHGDLMGAHKYIGKGILLEESVKVPFMIRFKTEPKQQMIIEDPVSLVDVVPTLLDLMEKPGHNRLQGQSLRPLMKGNPVPQDHVFIEWNPFQSWVDNALQEKSEKAIAVAESSRGVISPDGYKLILFNMGKNLLFNLKKDPYEMNNLYGQPGYEDIITNLTGKILEWQKEVGDSVSLEQNCIQY